jgi:hypothetical protein
MAARTLGIKIIQDRRKTPRPSFAAALSSVAVSLS